MSREWVNGVCVVGPIRAYTHNDGCQWYWRVSFSYHPQEFLQITDGQAPTEAAARAACEPYLPPEMPVVEWEYSARHLRWIARQESAERPALLTVRRVRGSKRHIYHIDYPDTRETLFDARWFLNPQDAQEACLKRYHRELRADHHERIFGEVQG